MTHVSIPAAPIHERSARQLAAEIAQGSLSSKTIVDALIARCEAVEPLLNAVSVPRFQEARSEAHRADLAVQSGQPLGPLHGVPITIKDSFALAGTTSTVGLPNHAQDAPASTDGPLVQCLREAGAIVVAKTNVPQLMYSHECANPLHGRTNNPWNPSRTPGGSSGGEAALIAAGASPLGLGSDQGGSIRVPAHFCGLVGLKPTSGRLTGEGHFRTLRGLKAIPVQPCPIARRVDDVELAYRVLLAGQSRLASDVPPAIADESSAVEVSKLRLGIFESHPLFPATPAIVRALRGARDILTNQGAHVASYEPPNFVDSISCYMSIMSADGGADLRRLAGRSRLQRGIRQTLWLSRLPQLLRQSLGMGASLLGQQQWAYLLRNSGPRSADAFWQLVDQQHRHREHTLCDLRERQFDAVLMPVHGLAAFRHGQSADLLLGGCYAYWANLLGLPAGSVPVAQVQPDDGLAQRDGRFDLLNRMIRHNEAQSAGLPVGVQVVAGPWREDTVLAVMRAIEAGAGFRCSPPGLPDNRPAAGD